MEDFRKRSRQYRPFPEARAFVQQLGFKNGEEWNAYCKSGKKPKDIPSAPHYIYKTEFKGMGDWLGTGTVAPRDRHRQYRSFTDARAFARELGFKNKAEWDDYCRSGKKPTGIPMKPDRAYGSEFQGYGDWLGTGRPGPGNYTFLPFAEARTFAHALKLKNHKEWSTYCASGKKPYNIPSAPNETYGVEFQGWGDWLGTGYISNRHRKHRPFAEARAFVHTLGLGNQKEWVKYCSSGNKPEDIPTNPQRAYKPQFKGMGDWLGTGNMHSRDLVFRPFAEARVFVHTLGFKNHKEWQAYCTSGKKPPDIPSTPHQEYNAEFKGYGDWLGTGTLSRWNREYLPFAEARAFVHTLGLKNRDEWSIYCKSGKKPNALPADPHQLYDIEFKGMGDWLGVINIWNRNALLALLHDLRPRLNQLEERELYIILQQGGVLTGLRKALKGASPMRVLKDLKDNNGKELEWALRGIIDEEITALEDDALSRETIPEVGDLETLDVARIFERTDDDTADLQTPSLISNDTPLTDVDKQLPALPTKESLRVIDLLQDLSCGLDDEAAEYLIANRVSTLWECYIGEGKATVDDLLSGNGGYWFSEIKSRFLSEVKDVEGLVIPEGWSFTASDGKPALPNAMQRRTAWAVRERRRVGNWSGVGAGKTLSAVLASRVIDAHVTLVVTNNATVEGWRHQIEDAYPDSIVYTHMHDVLVLDRDRFNYVVLNYEKFQGSERNHLVHLLLGLGLDFVVFDEVQFVKQRDIHASNRRRVLEALVSGAAEINPHLRVLGMSATPVINNLLEAKKLLEIVTGTQFAEVETVPTVNNALAIHRMLMLHGFRYHPRYTQEMRTEIVTTRRNDLLEALRGVGTNILHLEQILLPAKLEAARRYFRPGTIVYAHYVDEIVAPIRCYLEDVGLTVGLYTGVDKSGLARFLARKVDVLVGTKPVGTGLDGLQRVCNRIVMLCLPWTSAEYEQIIGRIRRQGSCFGEVEIIIPQVTLDYEGDVWSWDQGRMACIQYKRTLSDCAVDGSIPETVRIDQNILLKQSREALERWIERIGDKGLLSVERQRLAVPLPPDLRQKVLLRHGDFTILNHRWNTSRSMTTHDRIQHDPSEWYLYHTLYREAREGWPEQPFERIAERIRVRPDWVVVDFGCGECLLKHALSNNHVVGIDYVAWDEQVVACDMASTPLEDATFDVAVFSLSLMGTNWADYLKEAYRLLKPYGHLFIAEPQKKWQERNEELKQVVTVQGFRLLGEVEQRYDFIYLTAIKA